MKTSKDFAQSIVQNPWKVIAASLALVFFVGYFMQFVAPSVSFKDMLGEDFPQLKKYEKVQAEYTNDDNLLVFIEAKNGDTFTRDILSGVIELTDELWKTPHSIRIDSVTNYQHTEADGDDLYVGDLVENPKELSDSQIAKIRDIAISEPLTVNRVVNKDGSVLAINVSFAFPNINGNEKLDSDAFVQALAEKFRVDFLHTNVYVGGLTALDATVMKISMKESGLFLGIMMLVVVILLALLLRTFKPLIASIFVFIFSIMAGVAFSGMMGWKLTPFTSSVPMIILIIAVADCVHLITAFMQRFNAGESKKDALSDALRSNFKAIFITSTTTAIGFLTLNFSDSSSIAALGSQSAFGVMFAFVLSVTFLPAVISLTPMKPGVDGKRNTGKFDDITEFLFKYKLIVLLSSLVVAVFLGYSTTKNEFNDNIPTYFAKSLPWRQANDFSEKEFGGAYTFSYSLESGAENGVPDPVFLEKVDNFASYLRGLPEVAYVNSIGDTFKRLNKNMNGDDPAFYKMPEDRQLASQYLLLYEMSLPFGLDLNNQINLDKSATKVLAAFKTMSTSEVLAMEKKIDVWIANNLDGVTSTSSGVQIMFAHLLDADTKGLTMGALFGLLIISFLLIFMLKSLKTGLVSILPNLLPAIFAFGVWGILVGQIGMGLAMVSGISIGIIVDDTVHFLIKYLKARNEKGYSVKQAISYTYEEVGAAIVFTTVVLVTGFLIMAFISEFRVNSDMGKMTAIILSFALLFDLVALPAFLMMFDKDPATVKNQNLQNVTA